MTGLAKLGEGCEEEDWFQIAPPPFASCAVLGTSQPRHQKNRLENNNIQ